MLLFVLLAILLTNVNGIFEDVSKPQPTPFQDWDYLVYSQRWPLTACTQWEEKGSQNSCYLPQKSDTWTVHGVWPNKIGAKGPFFCSSALHFDPDQLTPMMDELMQFWPNIENNTQLNSLWKHEWNKHGTCASVLPQLNSVTNYFRKGLQWNQDYNITEVLAENNIVPNAEGYNISTIYDSVKTTLGKNPKIQCVVDAKSKLSLISEIRICFDKDLDLIDCNVGQDELGDDVMGNCNAKENVVYLATLPNNTVTENGLVGDQPRINGCIDSSYYQEHLLQIYSIIKFVMWFTL